MKVFWLITLFFSFVMATDFQIVTSAYSLEKNALMGEKELATFLHKKKDFFTKNTLKINHKKKCKLLPRHD